MTIKTTVRLIRNANLLLLLGLVVAVIAILMRAHAGSNILALELCIGGACIILFFFRSLFVTRALKTSQHRRIFTRKPSDHRDPGAPTQSAQPLDPNHLRRRHHSRVVRPLYLTTADPAFYHRSPCPRGKYGQLP